MNEQISDSKMCTINRQIQTSYFEQINRTGNLNLLQYYHYISPMLLAYAFAIYHSKCNAENRDEEPVPKGVNALFLYQWERMDSNVFFHEYRKMINDLSCLSDIRLLNSYFMNQVLNDYHLLCEFGMEYHCRYFPSLLLSNFALEESIGQRIEFYRFSNYKTSLLIKDMNKLLNV